MVTMPRLFAVPLVGCLLATCSGCQDYVARRDTLTLGSGDAVQANIAKQVIDPWPPESNTVDPYTDGERLAHGIERYRNPSTGTGVAVLPPIPIGPANVPSVSTSPVTR